MSDTRLKLRRFNSEIDELARDIEMKVPELLGSGTPGPPGVAGPQGPEGPAGTPGATGPVGASGSGGVVYSTAIGDGSATSFTVTHSFSTRDVSVAVYRTAAPYDVVVAEIEYTTVNAVTVRTQAAPAAGEYTVLVAAVSAGGAGIAGDKNYVHTQLSLASTWTVAHGLGKYPAVDVLDSGGTWLLPNVTYPDANTVTLTFAAPTSGKAFVN